MATRTRAEPIADDGSPLALFCTTPGGATLDELSRERPLFLVLLRHAGCTFAREAVADLREAESPIEAAGARLVVVHMGEEGPAMAKASGRYDLGGVSQVADPHRRLYRWLGLPRGRLSQLFGWKELARGAKACLLEGHGVGRLQGDGFQLGGLALVSGGRVVWRRPLSSASERPDYAAEANRAISELPTEQPA
ncbi:AhpC/TSA family protein [Botrimarina sp.]|uniref:AhpC/TSA family protein n=1 Tax=Botrimarina sp. TaxID=2795802 RepID=UPI0032EE6E84